MSEQSNSHQHMREALNRTVRHVVETMCFSEVAPTADLWQNADTIVTAVNFYGSRSGRLQLEVSSSAAWSLREAFLGAGQEQNTEDDTAGLVVEELGNMICGRFLSAVDPLSEMSLGRPEPSKKAAAPSSDALQSVRQGFLLESGHLTASVEFDREKRA